MKIAIPYGVTTISVGHITIFTAKIRVKQANSHHITMLMEEASTYFLKGVKINAFISKRVSKRTGIRSSYVTYEISTVDFTLISEFNAILKKAKIERLQKEISYIQTELYGGEPEEYHIPAYNNYISNINGLNDTDLAD